MNGASESRNLQYIFRGWNILAAMHVHGMCVYLDGACEQLLTPQYNNTLHILVCSVYEANNISWCKSFSTCVYALFVSNFAGGGFSFVILLSSFMCSFCLKCCCLFRQRCEHFRFFISFNNISFARCEKWYAAFTENIDSSNLFYCCICHWTMKMILPHSPPLVLLKWSAPSTITTRESRISRLKWRFSGHSFYFHFHLQCKGLSVTYELWPFHNAFHSLCVWYSFSRLFNFLPLNRKKKNIWWELRSTNWNQAKFGWITQPLIGLVGRRVGFFAR